jgi:septal ring factor EnvC (AmiA/AmiB activator)
MRYLLPVLFLVTQAWVPNDDPELSAACVCVAQIAAASASVLDTATVQDQAIQDALEAEIRARIAAANETREQFDWMSARLREDVGMLNDKILRLQARLDALGAS